MKKKIENEELANAALIKKQPPMPPLPPFFPIGSICASVLEYNQFLKVNEDNQTEFNVTKSRWAPCDGRKVTGSRYAGIVSITNVPDLRGLFLRGLNDMGVSLAPTANPNHLNTEIKKAGEFQIDMYKKHSHSFSGGDDITTNPHKNTFKGATEFNKFLGETNSNGGEETRPKNISVFYYIRIN